jgi:imidazolonepropionase-like amidohydrolase
MMRILADVLIPGRGAPMDGACVVVNGREMSYVGPAADAPPGGDDVRVPVLMPGLWDCHGHFLGARTADLMETALTPTAVAAARAAKDAETALRAGFTSVREAGGLGVHLARVIDEGLLAGPSIYAPGAILSQTGGHGDLHGVALPWMLDFCHRGGCLRLCDGVPECIKAVREQLRLGARVIKVCASGGVTSELDDPVHQQFSDDELRAIVEEAGRAERVVMAHCHGKPGIMAALRAGCRTIEHGSYLDEESAAAMREAGAILVPTRLIVERLLLFKDRVPPYAFAKLEVIANRHLAAIQVAHEAGVTIALGTDIFGSGSDTPVPWGMNAMELKHLVDAGLSPLEAIEAGTAVGPLTLGPQAPKAGLIAEGYDADLLALATNPLDDMTAMNDPHNILGVWKHGRRVGGTEALT